MLFLSAAPLSPFFPPRALSPPSASGPGKPRALRAVPLFPAPRAAMDTRAFPAAGVCRPARVPPAARIPGPRAFLAGLPFPVPAGPGACALRCLLRLRCTFRVSVPGRIAFSHLRSPLAGLPSAWGGLTYGPGRLRAARHPRYARGVSRPLPFASVRFRCFRAVLTPAGMPCGGGLPSGRPAFRRDCRPSGLPHAGHAPRRVAARVVCRSPGLPAPPHCASLGRGRPDAARRPPAAGRAAPAHGAHGAGSRELSGRMPLRGLPRAEAWRPVDCLRDRDAPACGRGPSGDLGPATPRGCPAVRRAGPCGVMPGAMPIGAIPLGAIPPPEEATARAANAPPAYPPIYMTHAYDRAAHFAGPAPVYGAWPEPRVAQYPMLRTARLTGRPSAAGERSAAATAPPAYVAGFRLPPAYVMDSGDGPSAPPGERAARERFAVSIRGGFSSNPSAFVAASLRGATGCGESAWARPPG